MDDLESLMWTIGYCVLTGDVALAREYAADYALLRDGRLTSDELIATVRARFEVA